MRGGQTPAPGNPDASCAASEGVMTGSASWHLLTGRVPTKRLAAFPTIQNSLHIAFRQRAPVFTFGRGEVRAAGPTGQLKSTSFRALVRPACGSSRRNWVASAGPNDYSYNMWLLHLDSGGSMCRSVCSYTVDPEEIWVQFHEVAHGFAWHQSPRRNLLAMVQHWMAYVVSERAQRLFVSVPGWRAQLGSSAQRAEVLPIPSNLPNQLDPHDVASLRANFGPAPLIGHFGTYGPPILDLLKPIIVTILQETKDVRFLFLGRGSEAFAEYLRGNHPGLAPRLIAPGVFRAMHVALHIAACDVLLQPYPDGVSGRRTTAMAGMALGKAIVTTSGHLTEEGWASSAAVRSSPQ